MPTKAVAERGRFLQRSFDHLINVRTKKFERLPTRVQRAQPFVPPKDRIPLWNISHGDRVRVISGDKKGQIGTVDYVDRMTNRVYLNEAEFHRRKTVPSARKGAIFNDPNFRPEQTTLLPVPIHYSNLQLVLQMTPEQAARAEAERGDTDAAMPELVATRLRAANVHYDWVGKRWSWKRIAENVAQVDMATQTTTSLPVEEEQRSPAFKRYHPPRPRAPSRADTPTSIVQESTFVPDLAAPELKIRDIEFVNIHGRAKRTQRWNDARLLEAQLAT